MTGKEHKTPERDEQFDKEYLGNIWGWKFSFFGLILILTLVFAMWYKHKATNTQPGFEKTESPIDKIFD